MNLLPHTFSPRLVLLTGILFLGISFSSISSGQSDEALDSIVAIVEKEIITRSELETELHQTRSRLVSQGVTMPPEETLRKQLLNHLVIRSLQLQFAIQNRMTVSESELTANWDALLANRSRVQEAGNGVDNLSELEKTQLRERLREDLLLRRLQGSFLSPEITIGNSEIEEYMKSTALVEKLGLKYDISHILLEFTQPITPDNKIQTHASATQLREQLLAGEIAFSEAAIRYSTATNASNGGRIGWISPSDLPPLFRSALTNLEKGELSPLLEADSGLHLLLLHDVTGRIKQRVNQYKASHLLLRTNILTPESQVISRLKVIRDRIIAGEDFAKLAETHSMDVHTRSQGGSLGWVGEGEIAPELYQSLTTLEVGEVSKPIKSNQGVHLLLLEDMKQLESGEETIRQSVINHLRLEKANAQYQQWLTSLRESAYVELR